MKCDLCGKDKKCNKFNGPDTFEHSEEDIEDYLRGILRPMKYADKQIHRFFEGFEKEFVSKFRGLNICNGCQSDKHFQEKIDESFAKQTYRWLKKNKSKMIDDAVIGMFKSGAVDCYNRRFKADRCR